MALKVELKSVGQAIRRNAAAKPEAMAIVSSGYQPMSYRQLAAQFDAFAAALHSAGLGRASRVAIGLKDAPQAALAIVSVCCAAVAVPLDPNLTAVEIETRLKLLEADAAILLASDDSPLRDAVKRLKIPVIEAAAAAERRLDLSLIVPGEACSAATNDHPEPGSPAFILQTSGTTAEPKLIPYSHRNMLATAARVRGWFNLDDHDRCLSVSPVYYCHGLTLTVLAPLLSGGSVAFPSSPSRLDLTEWFSSLQPSWLSASPTTYRAILEKVHLIEGRGIKHNLRFALSGGAPLHPEIQAGLQSALGVPVLEHYGATEAGQISTNLPPPGPAKEGTCGVPDPDTLKVVGDDDTSLAPSNRGEILVGGPTVIGGYLNASELNEVTFEDGWYRTGDLGSIDEQGFLTLHGRMTEVINRGGEKIAPMEIDVALLRHPDVAEAAAFAVPHLRLGEDIAAAVVLRPEATATPDELRRFLGTQLAWFKVPRRITIVQDLPKGSTGKVQRRKLSEG